MGRARWTLELLAGEMVKLTAHESLSRETVRRRLVENDLKPWRKKMWCIPQVARVPSNGRLVALQWGGLWLFIYFSRAFATNMAASLAQAQTVARQAEPTNRAIIAVSE